ncbi:hypothetical protein SODALDRAFT_327155 [Sodiomyces alkalinus F11]|uniref:Uncharacterized protein n=1 Tax=Sodiomyces alkalinus (strain CBS 110278 / VKM F-3762 / F11) TaxID=1314773 RepID=A0A3N2Q888_SODAK|nr:hypothetical protein SODALDRAFT_327155 [Sodiomyces alkalinus F11]ROT42989.1 hypothetical protein SODALDRAFT_327155 [Sodiomyces alkalinus F11]
MDRRHSALGVSETNSPNGLVRLHLDPVHILKYHSVRRVVVLMVVVYRSALRVFFLLPYNA